MRNDFSKRQSASILTSLLSMWAAFSPAAVAESSLDLSSAKTSVSSSLAGTIGVGGQIGSNGSVTGSTPMTVSKGQLLTPAEALALSQSANGAQKLLLGSSGAAVGGSAMVAAHPTSIPTMSVGSNLSAIVVPQGVVLSTIGYNSSNPLNVSGASIILGAFHSLQTSPGLKSVLNFGSDLTIGKDGLLTGLLPTQTVAGLFASDHLDLNVLGNLTNNGTISVLGNLNLNVSGAISNDTIGGATSALMSAQNLNIVAGSGLITNSGIMSALNSINLHTGSNALSVDNSNGILEALKSYNANGDLIGHGVINFRKDGPELENANVKVSGGDISAAGGINVYGKDIAVDVEKIDGQISSKGSTAHVSVKSGDLFLGQQLLSGDPSYYNNAGDITIGDLTTVGGDLAIVASGSINTTSKTTIQTTAAGNSIFLGAGLNFNIGGGTNMPSVPAQDPGDTTSTLTFDGTTNAGGNINSAGNQLNLQTTGSGKITMVATGSINLGGGAIKAEDAGVLAISGTDFLGKGSSLTTKTGNVTIASAALSDLTGMQITNGTLSSLPSIGAPANGSVNLPAITSTSGSVNASTGDAILRLNNSISTAGPVELSTTGSGAIGGGTANGSSLTINAGGNVDLLTNAPFFAITQSDPSGAVFLNASNITSNGPSNAGSGGFHLTASSMSISSSISSSGTVELKGTSLVLSSTPVSGKTISLDASAGSISGSGPISASSSVTVKATGGMNLTGVSAPAISCDVKGTANLGVVGTTEVKIAGDNNTDYNITSSTGVLTVDAFVSFSTQSPRNVVINADNIVYKNGAVDSLTFNGVTPDGSFSSNTNMSLALEGNVTAKTGDINILAAPGQDLSIGFATTGATVTTLTQNKSINISVFDSTRSPSIILGEPSAVWTVRMGDDNKGTYGGFFNVTTGPLGSISINPSGTSFSFNYDNSHVTFTSGSVFGDLANIRVQDKNHPNLNSTFSINSPNGPLTIANSAGPLDLSQLTSLVFPGRSLALLSASDIVNNSLNPLLIDLSGPGFGGSLTMIAGFDFSPSTGGVNVGPNNSSYKLIQKNTPGGSINLGLLTIDTSGANGAGNVLIAANGPIDSTNSTIIASSSDGNAGDIRLFGTSITSGTISALGPFPESSGDVAMTSMKAILLEGPGKIENGCLVGAITITGNASGSVVVNNPISSYTVNLRADTVSGTGLISTNGVIAFALSKATFTNLATGFLNIQGPLEISVKNTGDLTNVILTGGTIDLVNEGNVITPNFGSTSIQANDRINITLSGPGYTWSRGTISTIQPGSIITIVADDVDFLNGSVSANSVGFGQTSTGTVIIKPFTESRPININGGSGGLQISESDLHRISSTGTLVLGSPETNGGINSFGPISWSGQAAATYDFQMIQGAGNFTNFSTFNTKGSKTLAINVAGTVTAGTLQTAGTNLSITGGSVAFNKSITTIANIDVHSDSVTVDDAVKVQGASLGVSGISTNGSIIGSKGMVLSNSGVLRTTSGNITVASAAGQDLLITGNGNGQFIVPAAKTISFTATNNPSVRSPDLILGPGNQSFTVGTGVSPGGAVSFSAAGSPISSLTIEPSVIYDFPSDFSNVSVNVGAFYGDPSQFQVHTAGHPNPNSTFTINFVGGPGTIANSAGAVDLSQLSNLNFAGNIAILAATNIVNSGSGTTLNLSSTNGVGANLTLIAGFDFTPGTGGQTKIPTSTDYTLLNPDALTKGGSIDIGNVNIDTHGATGGGNVLAVAYTGTVPGSGSIKVGTINASGGSGNGGSVILTGNGIQADVIDTRADMLANSGTVSLNSTASVTLSNPGNTHVVNGVVTGGTFLPGTKSGTILLSDVYTGASAFNANGGNIQGTGLIKSGSVALDAIDSVGKSSSVLSTATGLLTVNAGIEIAISNSGAISSLSSSTSKTFILYNDSAIAIAPTGLTSAGSITLAAVANDGSIDASNGSISAGGLLSLSTHGAGTIVVAVGKSLSTTGNNDMVLSSAGVAFTGNVNAGTGSVTLEPNVISSDIGVNGAIGSYQISAQTLGKITASTVIVGTKSGTGNISVNNSGGILNQSTNLTFLGSQASSSFSNFGTIAMGEKTLFVDVGGPVKTGKITGAATSVTLTGSSIDLNGDITITGVSSTTMHATGPSGSGAISGAFPISVATLSLTSDHDSIGSIANPILLGAPSTSVNASASGAGSSVTLAAMNGAQEIIANNIASDDSVLLMAGADQGSKITIPASGSITSKNSSVTIDSFNIENSGTINSGFVGANAITLINSIGSLTLSGTGILNASKAGSTVRIRGIDLILTPGLDQTIANGIGFIIDGEYSITSAGAATLKGTGSSLVSTGSLLGGEAGSISFGGPVSIDVSSILTSLISPDTIMIFGGSMDTNSSVYISAPRIGVSAPSVNLVINTPGSTTLAVIATGISGSGNVSIVGKGNNLTIGSVNGIDGITLNDDLRVVLNAVSGGSSLIAVDKEINTKQGLISLDAGAIAINAPIISQRPSAIITFKTDNIIQTSNHEIRAEEAVQVVPLTSGIDVAFNGTAPGKLSLPSAFLANLNTKNLWCCSDGFDLNTEVGDISVQAPFDVSAGLYGSYYLRFTTDGSFYQNGHALITPDGMSIEGHRHALAVSAFLDSINGMGGINGFPNRLVVCAQDITLHGNFTGFNNVQLTAGADTVLDSGTGRIIIDKSLTIEASAFVQVIHNNSQALWSSTGNVLSIDTGVFTLYGDPENVSTGNNLNVSIDADTIDFRSSLETKGSMVMNVRDLQVWNTLSAGSISVTGTNGAPLLIGKGGTLETTAGDISIASAPGQNLVAGTAGSGGLLIANSGKISLTATDNGSSNIVDLLGNLTFSSPTTLNAAGIGQAITVDSGANIVGNKALIINSDKLNLNGTISGNPLVLRAQGGGTIANSNPSVALDLKNLGSLSFQGKDLTILSAGNIINSGAPIVIDLSGTNFGSLSSEIGSGSLNVIAGFNFTGGAISPILPPSSGTFQLTTSNAGKNIDFSKVTITSSFGNSGGNILAVATGSVKLGAINVSASQSGGIGGSVSVFGNGIKVGTINTSAFTSGSTTLTSGVPSIAGGPIAISNGRLFGGTFTVSSAGGNVLVTSINGGNGNASISTGGVGTITQSAGTTITTTGTLTVSTGSKGFSIKTAASNIQLNTGNVSGANVTVTSNVSTTLLHSVVGGNLKVSSSAGLAVGFAQTVQAGGSLSLINSSLNADLFANDAANLQAGKEISLSSPGRIYVGAGAINTNSFFSAKSTSGYVDISGAAVNSGTTITLSAVTGISIGSGSQLHSAGNLTLTASDAYANITVENGVNLQAGNPNGVLPPNGVLHPSEIASKGSVILTAGSAIGIGNSNIWTSYGGDIKATAKGVAGAAIGQLSMYQNNQFTANGGNIVMLAKGSVFGNDGNVFHARAYGTSAANGKGGGIEIGSGLTTSTFLNSAFALPKNTNPAAGVLGLNVQYTGNLGGVIKANLLGGTINLNATNLNPSLLNLNGNLVTGGGGAQVFDAKGAGSQVIFDHATFQTEAFKPIAMVTVDTVELTSEPVRFKRFDSGEKSVAIGNAETELKLIEINDDFIDIVSAEGFQNISKRYLLAQVFCRAKTKLLHSKNSLLLEDGEAFINALAPTIIQTADVQVHAVRGAMFSVQHSQCRTYLRVCSDNGTVTALVNGKTVHLHSGEELLVCDHRPDHSETVPEDGIGRRFSRTTVCGDKYVTVSDFSMISMLGSSSFLPKQIKSHESPNTLSQLTARILKTAATVEAVLKQRGPYLAR